MKKFAFTLAEVLIALVIVGVVAALTVPQVVTKIQRYSDIVALKKAYSILSQIHLKLQDEYGSDFVRLSCKTNDSKCAGDLFKGELKLLNTKQWVPNRTIANNCWQDSNISNKDETHYCTVSSDGIVYDFDMEFGKDHLQYSNFYAAMVNIDTNGVKKPNKYGRDRYTLVILNNKVIPYKGGMDNNGLNLKCTNGEDGSFSMDFACAYVYLMTK